jgi:DNA polymerase-3 subunit epsilon
MPTKEVKGFYGPDGNKSQIIVLDIETAGFSLSDPILEVGMCLLDLESGDIDIVFDAPVMEIKCFTEKCKKAWIFSHSDLSYDKVCEAFGLDFYRPAIEFWFDKFPVAAYNAPFDFRFLKDRKFFFEGLPDPMRLSTPILKLPKKGGGFKWPKVEEAWKYYCPDVKYTELHRGADDAVHEAKIILEMYNRDEFVIPEAIMKL